MWRDAHTHTHVSYIKKKEKMSKRAHNDTVDSLIPHKRHATTCTQQQPTTPRDKVHRPCVRLSDRIENFYGGMKSGEIYVFCHGGEGTYKPSRPTPLFKWPHDVTPCITCGRPHWTHLIDPPQVVQPKPPPPPTISENIMKNVTVYSCASATPTRLLSPMYHTPFVLSKNSMVHLCQAGIVPETFISHDMCFPTVEHAWRGLVTSNALCDLVQYTVDGECGAAAMSNAAFETYFRKVFRGVGSASRWYTRQCTGVVAKLTCRKKMRRCEVCWCATNDILLRTTITEAMLLQNEHVTTALLGTGCTYLVEEDATDTNMGAVLDTTVSSGSVAHGNNLGGVCLMRIRSTLR